MKDGSPARSIPAEYGYVARNRYLKQTNLDNEEAHHRVGGPVDKI
jgi:hypothetical protein